MWVSCPMAVASQTWLSNDAKVRIRMTHPYRSFTNDSSVTLNAYKPLYQFSTDSKVGLVKQAEVAKSAHPAPPALRAEGVPIAPISPSLSHSEVTMG